MNALLEPTSAPELVELVRSHEHVVAVGAGTKPRLSLVSDSFRRVSMRKLRGIVEYEPDEYTITALAGTPLSELDAALASKRQYLPFDPLFSMAGATLGGAIAADTSGPGRFRFGGVRDFILGVRFVDGTGRLLRVGGKVVKNAAGFDVPKFFVGSLGRFGVLSEITLKVLPRPVSTLTLQLRADNLDETLRILREAGNGRWQPDALDLPPSGGSVCLRLAGPPAALTALSTDILRRWPGEAMTQPEADLLWSDLAEMRWAQPDGVLVKVALTLSQVGPLIGLVRSLRPARAHISAGGSVAFISLPLADPPAELEKQLRALDLRAVAWRGRSGLWLGPHCSSDIAHAIKDAFDPHHRFPALDE